LPALYLALGARSLPKDPGRTHWQAVQAAAQEQSALHTIALACRAIFDGDKMGLTGNCSGQLKVMRVRTRFQRKDAARLFCLLTVSTAPVVCRKAKR